MRLWMVVALGGALWSCAQATAPEEEDALTSNVTPPGADAYRARDMRVDARTVDAAPTSPSDAGPDVPPPMDASVSSDASILDARPIEPDMGNRPPPDMLPPDMRVVDAALPDQGCAQNAEVCNGADDDCDGAVDEAGCGAWIASHCAVALGWADNRRQPAGPQRTWGDCPAAQRDMVGPVRCTQTRRDEAFVHLDTDGNVDENDQFGVYFDCADANDQALANYVPTHCAVFLGWADNERGPDNVDSWGNCPAALEGGGQLRCTSSGYDRRFRALYTDGDVDNNDDFGIAFICRDAENPQRAEALEASVEVQLAWASGNQGPPDGAAQWTARCPASETRGGQPVVCASSSGDGRFHQLDLSRDIDGDDDFGIALKPR